MLIIDMSNTPKYLLNYSAKLQSFLSIALCHIIIMLCVLCIHILTFSLFLSHSYSHQCLKEKVNCPLQVDLFSTVLPVGQMTCLGGRAPSLSKLQCRSTGISHCFTLLPGCSVCVRARDWETFTCDTTEKTEHTRGVVVQ